MSSQLRGCPVYFLYILLLLLLLLAHSHRTDRQTSECALASDVGTVDTTTLTLTLGWTYVRTLCKLSKSSSTVKVFFNMFRNEFDQSSISLIGPGERKHYIYTIDFIVPYFIVAVGYAVKIPLTPLSTCGEPTSSPIFAFAMMACVISEMVDKGRERIKVVFFNSKDIYLTR